MTLPTAKKSSGKPFLVLFLLFPTVFFVGKGIISYSEHSGEDNGENVEVCTSKIKSSK